jgi:hypothetical protein
MSPIKHIFFVAKRFYITIYIQSCWWSSLDSLIDLSRWGHFVELIIFHCYYFAGNSVELY